MAELVRLKHITRQNDWKLYFYSSVAHVKSGVVELPADDFTRIRRAWLMGFRQTEDGQPISANRFSDIVAKATVKDSSEEPVSEQKNSSRRRQPRPANGVRQGQSGSGGNADAVGPPRSVSRRSGKSEERPAADTGNDSEVPTD